MSKKSDARKTLESSIISGLAKRAHLTGVTIDKADILVPDLIDEIFHNESVNWAVRKYMDEINNKSEKEVIILLIVSVSIFIISMGLLCILLFQY